MRTIRKFLFIKYIFGSIFLDYQVDMQHTTLTNINTN